MAITASYGFAGTINESQWSTLHSPVNSGHVEGMVASVGSGTREVDLTSGTAWAVGTYHIASATTVALSANSSGNTRIDTIVVEVDFSTDAASVTAVEGTPAAAPVAPTLTQTAGTTWQIPLCDIVVVDGETAFSTADITDKRPSLTGGTYTVERSGWTGGMAFSRFGPLVTARFNATPDSGTANMSAGFEWGTVPEGWRPDVVVYVLLATTTGGTSSQTWRINTDGTVELLADVTGATALRGSTAFLGS